MNIDWRDYLHYGAGALLVLFGVLGELGVSLPGITVDPHVALAAGLGIFGVGAKADRALRSIGAFPFAVGAMLLAMNCAFAADVKPIYKSAAVPYASCTSTACTGLFIGGTFANNGGTFDLVGSGLNGLASNGLGLGLQGGYEYFANNLYAAAYVDIACDIASNSAPGAGIGERCSYGIGARLGYSLANAIGSVTTTGATSTLPQELMRSLMTPYINLKEAKRHNQPAIGTGVGLEALLAADPTGHSSWTANIDYLHYKYNQGGSASAIAAMTDENEIRLSINRHFGF